MKFDMWKGKQFPRNGKSYSGITEFTFYCNPVAKHYSEVYSLRYFLQLPQQLSPT